MTKRFDLYFGKGKPYMEVFWSFETLLQAKKALERLKQEYGSDNAKWSIEEVKQEVRKTIESSER